MFVNAIETAGEYTRAIHTIQHFHGSDSALPGAATLFFVNDEGWALTCKHVAQQVMVADQLHAHTQAYREALAALEPGASADRREAVAREHGIQPGALTAMKNAFVNCADGIDEITLEFHPVHDVALVHFKGFSSLRVSSFPVFAGAHDALKQGRFLCRLGFPFPEFSNFRFDAATQAIEWTHEGRDSTPRFPIEGMVTRHLAEQDGSISGFELSTPGLRGMSGGPAFDTDARVWGMQSSTAHLDLDFDVDVEVTRGPELRRVSDSAFLHVGRCINVEVLKGFMREKGVRFLEG